MSDWWPRARALLLLAAFLPHIQTLADAYQKATGMLLAFTIAWFRLHHFKMSNIV